jgi:hypothetical protein
MLESRQLQFGYQSGAMTTDGVHALSSSATASIEIDPLLRLSCTTPGAGGIPCPTEHTVFVEKGVQSYKIKTTLRVRYVYIQFRFGIWLSTAGRYCMTSFLFFFSFTTLSLLAMCVRMRVMHAVRHH